MSTADPYAKLPSEGTTRTEISPKMITAIRGAGITSVAMVIMAFIFCMVQGANHSGIYLLAMNLIISSFVGLVNGWWYRNGDLDCEKYWFIILLCVVITFQCIITDIFVFNYPRPPNFEPSTILPPETTTLNPVI